jgi:hypothetical protein
MSPPHDETQRTRVRFRPVPGWEGDPAHGGATRRTPPEELEQWRRLAAAGRAQPADETTPGAHDGPARSIEPPPGPHDVSATGELPPPGEASLAPAITEAQAGAPAEAPNSIAPGPSAAGPSDDPTAVQRRPAIPPVAHSFPPEDVPPAPPVGFSLSPPPGPLETVQGPPRSRIVVGIAALLLLAALALGVTLFVGRYVGSPRPATPAPPAPTAAPSRPEPPSPGPSLPAAEPASPPGDSPAPSGSPPEPSSTPPALGPTEPEADAPSAPPAPVAPEVPPPDGVAVEAAPTPARSDATERTHQDPDALIAAGDAALAGGDAGRALALFERAIALDSHDPYGHAGAARACLALGRAEDAVRFAERAVAHRRRRASFRVLFGDALSAAGETDRARREWERALELDSDDETARARLAR